MKFRNVALLLVALVGVDAFSTPLLKSTMNTVGSSTELGVSNLGNVGLGPGEQVEEGDNGEEAERELIAGVDYEIPDHEAFRTSARSKNDKRCDDWFGSLLGEETGLLGPIADTARETLITPVELKNEVGLSRASKF